MSEAATSVAPENPPCGSRRENPKSRMFCVKYFYDIARDDDQGKNRLRVMFCRVSVAGKSANKRDNNDHAESDYIFPPAQELSLFLFV